jgi:hypothetical protein
MRHLSLFLCPGLLLSAALAHATPTYLDPDPDATRSVSAYLDSKDYPGAVKALNDQNNVGQALAEGLVDGNKANTESRRKVENGLLTYMRAAGTRTLARYNKPDGIDPAIRIRQKFAFAYKP